SAASTGLVLKRLITGRSRASIGPTQVFLRSPAIDGIPVLPGSQEVSFDRDFLSGWSQNLGLSLHTEAGQEVRHIMRLTEMFIAQLDREAPRTRHVLENVPKGKDDWKPHPKSMPLGRLAGLAATMPSWITLIITKDELELNPAPGKG